MDENKVYDCTDIELCRKYIAAIESAEKITDKIDKWLVSVEQLRNDDRLSYKFLNKINTAYWAMEAYLNEMREFCVVKE